MGRDVAERVREQVPAAVGAGAAMPHERRGPLLGNAAFPTEPPDEVAVDRFHQPAAITSSWSFGT